MERETRSLKFNALSDGLGFHPFADGLPYAPVSKRAGSVVPPPPPQSGTLQKSGVGAVAAGAARFISPQSAPAPRISAVAQQAASAAVAAGLDPDRNLTFSSTESAQSFGWIYFFKRGTAFVLDTTLNLSLCLGAMALAAWTQQIQIPEMVKPGMVGLVLAFLLCFNFVLILCQEAVFGTSFGKRICGLGIQGTTSRIVMRAVLFWLGALPAGAGVIWAIFDRRHRCWHDVASGLQPIEVARL